MSFAKYLSLLMGKSGHTYGQLSGYLEIQLAEAVVKSNYVKASALLKDPRVNVNWTYREKDFATCINMSAQKGDIKMMKLLKLHGADLSIRDSNRATPLAHAIYLKRRHVVNYILSTIE